MGADRFDSLDDRLSAWNASEMGSAGRECHQGRHPGLTSEERSRLKDPERENRKSRWANEALGKASALFAQAELDCKAT